ncbi:MAG: hypothetical protein E3J42_01640 [Dehalococcoidia bacterium]|nr:MAG: hypothetical protein E3J42_01640 [Dehalococcoidia bacterium]
MVTLPSRLTVTLFSSRRAITCFSSIAPQVWRLFRLRSAHEISLPFNLLIMTGVAC